MLHDPAQFTAREERQNVRGKYKLCSAEKYFGVQQKSGERSQFVIVASGMYESFMETFTKNDHFRAVFKLAEYNRVSFDVHHK